MLEMAAGGMTDQAIANKLGISISTIGTYWGRVRTKMGPLSRTELVAIHIQEKADRDLRELRSMNEKLSGELSSKESQNDLAAFQAILDWSPDGIFLVDLDGTILRANRVAGGMFGFRPDDLEGVRVARLIPERYHERHEEHRQDYLAQPERKMMGDHSGLPARRRDGSEFLICATLNCVDHHGKTLIVCAVRPARSLD